jgi:hypothetical protein
LSLSALFSLSLHAEHVLNIGLLLCKFGTGGSAPRTLKNCLLVAAGLFTCRLVWDSRARPPLVGLVVPVRYWAGPYVVKCGGPAESCAPGRKKRREENQNDGPSPKLRHAAAEKYLTDRDHVYTPPRWWFHTPRNQSLYVLNSSVCVFFLGATPTSVENKSLYNRSSCFHRSQLVSPTPAVKALAGRQPSWRFPPSAAPSNLRSPPEKPAALVVPDPRRRRLHSGKCCLWLRAAGDRSVAHPRITIRARGNK